MNHGLGILDSDEDGPSIQQDRAAQAMHAAGLDSDGDDVEKGDLVAAHASTALRVAASDDAPNDFKSLGLEGSDDEFDEKRGLEDEEDQQPAPGPKAFKPAHNYGPPEVV